MPEELTTVQVDLETSQILGRLAKQDFRSKTSEFRWLVAQELARRYSQPNPVITVEEALAQTSENC